MSTARPFAYNTGQPITGTTQLGDLAIGVDNLDYSEQPGGVQWWNGPDEELGYIIAHTTPLGNQPNPLGIPAYLGFWRSKVKTEESFIKISQWVAAKYGSPQTFATGLDASTWLNSNGFWTSYNQVVLTPTPTATQFILTPTPTPTETQVVPTPTPTETQAIPTPTPTETQVVPTPTPTPTETQVVPTPTPTETQPIPTPTPTETSLPVTGYSFNLVDLPYNFPSSGNSIMNSAGGITTGSTEINNLINAGQGFYFNSIDIDGFDRTNYFSAFTGQNITITFNQNGNVAIYSGNTDSLKRWSGGSDTGFVFGTGIGVPPSGTPSGTATLLQSSPVNYTIGQPVYVSVSFNTPPTPTPTPTMSTPTPTPTSGVTPTGFTVTVSQVGNDVVWSGSGSFNLTDLTLQSTSSISPGFASNSAIWAIGPNTSESVDNYGGASFTVYPASFGSGGPSAPISSGDGSMFGVLPGSPFRSIIVPTGYVSGTVISGSTTYSNTTIAGMGLTSGVYTWSWGSGPNVGTLTMTIE